MSERDGAGRDRRRVIPGVALVGIVTIVAILSFNAVARGPSWGLRLVETPRGVVAERVRGSGMAWDLGIRSNDRILTIDGQNARAFVSRSLNGASNIQFISEREVGQTVQSTFVSSSVLAAIFLVALILAVLGGIVYRWAPEPAIRLTFLTFTGSGAVGLMATPAAAMGYEWAYLISSTSAIIFATSFATFFLVFPRPLAWGRAAILGLVVVAGALVVANGSYLLSNKAFPSLLNMFLFLWFGILLILGTLTLAARLWNQANRRTLTPVLIGTGLGLAPLCLLNVIPFVLFHVQPISAELAAIGLIGIPIGFTYSILRRRLFALDALFRRALMYLVAVATLGALFGLALAVLRTIVGETGIVDVVAVLFAASFAPRLTTTFQHLIDATAYPSLFNAQSRALTYGQGSVRDFAGHVTREIRQLVPVRWTAIVSRQAFDSDESRDAERSVVLAVDGVLDKEALPTHWVGSELQFAKDMPGRLVVPLRIGERIWGALVVGPRLDGSPLYGIEFETITTFVERLSVPLEAAILREQADDEARFRKGLSALARDLAAAGSVDDVLQITAQRSMQLLGAESTTVWARQSDNMFGVLATAGASTEKLASQEPIDPRSLFTSGRSVVRQTYRSTNPGGAFSWIAFRLGGPIDYEALVIAFRADDRSPFGHQEERRVSEIVEHVNGALRRAHALAQAAEAETLREMNRFRTDFLDTVSHDLQNPLAVIAGFAELLQARAANSSPEFVQTCAASIMDAYRSCQRLIDNLLTSSRLEGGRLALQCEAIDIADVLPRLVEGYRVLPDGQRISLQTLESPLMVFADVSRVEQMIGNLVTNALRYAPSGPILLGARSGGPGEVWIEIRDFGAGIGPEDQPKIWEKFYRGANGQLGPRGAGVGLSVVRTLAELHGGRAEVESTLGEGSLFRLVLPTPDSSRPALLSDEGLVSTTKVLET